MTDQELYEGILAGDRQVMQYLYREYFSPIARHVQKNGGQETDAFDVFQDSVIALWVNVKDGKYEVRENARLSTYLQGISKNIWFAKQRKAAKIQVATAEAPVPAEPIEETQDYLSDSILQLEKAFNVLGDKCRRLLRLFYYEKIPLREIAKLMAYTEKTAKNNKYRCMQQLRTKLIPEND